MRRTSGALIYKPIIRSFAAPFRCTGYYFNATFCFSNSESASEADSVGRDAASGFQTVPKAESVGRGGTSGQVHRMGLGWGAGGGAVQQMGLSRCDGRER